MGTGKTHNRWKSEGSVGKSGFELAAIGLEAEFVLIVNDQRVRPEEIFSDPTEFVRGNLVHRVGRSYHLPTGAAVYFDTGVIEVATPAIEIEHGCAVRAGRSLWESILYIRKELDHWEKKTRNKARLVGFSAHYNVSVLPHPRAASRTTEKLALLLIHLLPFPVMLLATNRRSTGVGVRPRGERIEVTVDFTPSSSLMVATVTLATGIVREVSSWPSFDLAALKQRGLPSIAGFRPMRHTARQGWLARPFCYRQSPFTCDVDAPIWRISKRRSRAPSGKKRHDHASKSPAGAEGLMSLREISHSVFRYFRRPIARVSDPFTFRLIRSVMRGNIPSLLNLTDRPPEYENVGRLCTWDKLFSKRLAARSRYERVLMRAISGRKLRLSDGSYTPTGMRGWSQVTFRRDRDGVPHVLSIDYLLKHLEDWERN